MQRRNFLGSAAIVPVAALTAAAQQAAPTPPPAPNKGVRITVLKKVIQQEYQKYRDREIQVCTSMKDGQVFTIEYPPIAPPAGMCSWAWDDLRKSAHVVYSGRMERMVACCSDGYRPVFFLLERIA